MCISISWLCWICRHWARGYIFIALAFARRLNVATLFSGSPEHSHGAFMKHRIPVLIFFPCHDYWLRYRVHLSFFRCLPLFLPIFGSGGAESGRREGGGDRGAFDTGKLLATDRHFGCAILAARAKGGCRQVLGYFWFSVPVTIQLKMLSGRSFN